MIIGLTGKNGSGKTAVCEYLKSRGFAYRSLSDEIREEIQRRSRGIDRDTLIEVGNELRSKFGPGILAERIVADLENDLAAAHFDLFCPPKSNQPVRLRQNKLTP